MLITIQLDSNAWHRLCNTKPEHTTTPELSEIFESSAVRPAVVSIISECRAHRVSRMADDSQGRHQGQFSRVKAMEKCISSRMNAVEG